MKTFDVHVRETEASQYGGWGTIEAADMDAALAEAGRLIAANGWYHGFVVELDDDYEWVGDNIFV